MICKLVKDLADNSGICHARLKGNEYMTRGAGPSLSKKGVFYGQIALAFLASTTRFTAIR